MAEATITQNTRITLGALALLIALFGGTMWQANSIRISVVRLETTAEGLSKQVEKLADSLDDGDAKLHSLDGRVISLERRVDVLEKP